MGFSRREHGTAKALDSVVVIAGSSGDLIDAALTPPAVELYGQTLTDLFLVRTVLAMMDTSNTHDVARSVLHEGAVEGRKTNTKWTCGSRRGDQRSNQGAFRPHVDNMQHRFPAGDEVVLY